MTFRNVLFALTGLFLGLTAATQLPLHAQLPSATPPAPVGTAAPVRAEGTTTLQEALLKPYSFDFGQPTTLEQVVKRLSADLGGEVVLDLAALERLELEKTDTVELELKGSRLKTGLKLLLDQVELTYKLIPEDNLLILTDQEGSEDPLDKLWAEMSHMHRDLHDIQDALDGLLDRADAQDELRLRQPTIIEEMPSNGEAGENEPGTTAPTAPHPRSRL